MKNDIKPENKALRGKRMALNIFGVFIILLNIGVFVTVFLGDDLATVILVGADLVLLPLMSVFASRIQKAEQDQLRNAVVRTGLWAEIWDDHARGGFESNIRFDKAEDNQAYIDSIDFCYFRSKHEFLLSVDKDGLYIIADEETDEPKELDVPLSEVTSLEEFYSAIDRFADSVI